MRKSVGVGCLVSGAPGYWSSQGTPRVWQCCWSLRPKLEVWVGSFWG